MTGGECGTIHPMNIPLRIAICDDEKEIRDALKHLVSQTLPDAEAETFSSGETLIQSASAFDVFLLDIDMPGESGMRIAEQIRAWNAEAVLIFVTGYEEYMQEAFDVRAFHYLLKPVQPEKLSEVLIRAAAETKRHKGLERASILLKSGGVSRNIFSDEIIYLESSNKKVILTMTGNRVLEVYRKMEEMERMLDSSFFRCHRGYLVNMKYITAYRADEITLEEGHRVLMSHRRYPAFVKAFLRYAKGNDI